jgi:hypothetical protein
MNNPTFQTKQLVYFSCQFDTRLGAIALNEGESIKAVSDGLGQFDLYVEWTDGSLGKYDAMQVNLIAGYEAVQ